VRAVLQQAEPQIERERQQAAPTSPWRLLPDLLRNTVAFLALAISLLQEWQFQRQRSIGQRRRRHQTGPLQNHGRVGLGLPQVHPQDHQGRPFGSARVDAIVSTSTVKTCPTRFQLATRRARGNLRDNRDASLFGLFRSRLFPMTD
jgi:hypothetical protein